MVCKEDLLRFIQVIKICRSSITLMNVRAGSSLLDHFRLSLERLFSLLDHLNQIS